MKTKFYANNGTHFEIRIKKQILIINEKNTSLEVTASHKMQTKVIFFFNMFSQMNVYFQRI